MRQKVSFVRCIKPLRDLNEWISKGCDGVPTEIDKASLERLIKESEPYLYSPEYNLPWNTLENFCRIRSVTPEAVRVMRRLTVKMALRSQERHPSHYGNAHRISQKNCHTLLRFLAYAMETDKESGQLSVGFLNEFQCVLHYIESYASSVTHLLSSVANESVRKRQRIFVPFRKSLSNHHFPLGSVPQTVHSERKAKFILRDNVSSRNLLWQLNQFSETLLTVTGVKYPSRERRFVFSILISGLISYSSMP